VSGGPLGTASGDVTGVGVATEDVTGVEVAMGDVASTIRRAYRGVRPQRDGNAIGFQPRPAAGTLQNHSLHVKDVMS